MNFISKPPLGPGRAVPTPAAFSKGNMWPETHRRCILPPFWRLNFWSTVTAFFHNDFVYLSLKNKNFGGREEKRKMFSEDAISGGYF